MSTFQRLKEEFLKAIQQAARSKSSDYDTQAVVRRIDEEGTAWVHIDGGVEETPVELSIDAKEGDIVQVRVADGRAWMNGNNTAPPTDDTKANQAQESADNAQSAADQAQADIDEEKEYFWHDDAGAHVKGKAYRTDIKSDGMKIIEAATEEEVARFGADGSQIGKDDEGHVNIDYHSIKYTDIDGESFFEVVDKRNEEGIATITDNFISDGGDTFLLTFSAIDILSITLDGVEADPNSWEYLTIERPAIGFVDNIADGTEIEVVYTSATDEAKYFTLGSRVDGEKYGPMSFAVGSNNIASGLYSMTFGEFNQALGLYAAALGFHLIAENYQTVLGLYNARTYDAGLVVGNGTSVKRSNALVVRKNGDLEFALDSTATSGTVDGDLYAAINAKGWLNAIAGTGDLISLKLLLTKILQTI